MMGTHACRSVIYALALLILAVAAPRVQAQRISQIRPVPAPSLDNGGDWINVAKPIRLKDLRGKFVILDFWTYCCINCMHILPELKKLEKEFPNNLVVIGVHSPKFATERSTENVREAVLREKIEHPVVNDANRVLWRKYKADVWPSLRFIDPTGEVIAATKGELNFESMRRFMNSVIPAYRRRRLLDERPLRFQLEEYKEPERPLRFPGKVLADEASGRLFIADSYHNRIVVASLDGRLQAVIGSGQVGAKDGSFAEATFDHPQGMALHGNELYIADTENHKIRRANLEQKTVTTVAGTGKQRRKQDVRWSSRPRGTMLASPWDLLIQGDTLYIAMAGTHQIWFMQLDGRRIGPYAGNASEDIVDGPLLPRQPFQKGYSAFAQPSGLATDGNWLFVADSEGSSIRAVPLNAGAGNRVLTVLGTPRLPENQRLFTFGDRDGGLDRAMLQHPICVAYAGGFIFVADTYNNKVKAINVRAKSIRTLAGGRDSDAFNEPSGVSVAGSKLYVADTNGHRIQVVDLNNPANPSTLTIRGLKPPVKPPAEWVSLTSAAKETFADAAVQATGQTLKVQLQVTLPEGWKWNEDAGFRCRVQVAGDSDLFSKEAVAKIQNRELTPSSNVQLAVPLQKTAGADRIRFSLVYYYCREGFEAACRIGEVQWTGRVSVQAGAPQSAVKLTHRVQAP